MLDMDSLGFITEIMSMKIDQWPNQSPEPTGSAGHVTIEHSGSPCHRSRVARLGSLGHIMKAYFPLFCVSFVLGCSTIHTGQIAISIRGQVRYPGNYVLPVGTKLSEAVIGAGDFTDSAFVERVMVIHRDGTTEHSNLRDLPQGDVILIAGDEVRVPKAIW